LSANGAKINLYDLTLDELTARLAEWGYPAFRARQVWEWLYRHYAADFAPMTNLPGALRERLAAETTLSIGEVVLSQHSSDGQTKKVLFRMPDGQFIETVLMGYEKRRTLCISTQAGCAMGCVFCATGQMGFERNLKAEEVAAQAVHIARVLRARGEHITNVVFMGMGEPLANYGETIRAVRLLTDRRAFGLAQRAITISTVGVIRGIDRLAAENLQVGLAISLHAPNDALRQQLVPTAGPHSVAGIMAAARRYFTATGRRVTFEYALIDGVNDTPGLAAELARLLRGTGIHVNLIPVNPTAGGFRRPARQRVIAFERTLREAGVNVTVRIEKGSEIAAACGQLRTGEAPARVDFEPLSPPGAAAPHVPRPAAPAPSQSPRR